MVGEYLSKNITVFADENQRLMEHNSTLADIRLYSGISGETFELRRNYRNTLEIAALARHFCVDTKNLPDLPTRRREKPSRPATREPRRTVDFIRTTARNNDDLQIGVFTQTKSSRTRSAAGSRRSEYPFSPTRWPRGKGDPGRLRGSRRLRRQLPVGEGSRVRHRRPPRAPGCVARRAQPGNPNALLRPHVPRPRRALPLLLGRRRTGDRRRPSIRPGDEMTDEQTLFAERHAPATRSPAPLVYLTNRENLREVLSAAAVEPRPAFDKYYRDLLEDAGGRLVLSGRRSTRVCSTLVTEESRCELSPS